MSAVPISGILQVFNSDELTRRAAQLKDFSSLRLTDEQKPESVAGDVDPFQAGLEAGRAELRDELNIRLKAQQEQFSEQLEGERIAWQVAHANTASTSIETALAGMETRVGEAVAAILKPFLAEAQIVKALNDLHTSIFEISDANPGTRIVISGPEFLVERLRGSLTELAGAVEYESSEQSEIRVVLDDTILESRLGIWMESLEKIVA